jgi:glycosyltransferase involved in cell wall biosynthesis
MEDEFCLSARKWILNTKELNSEATQEFIKRFRYGFYFKNWLVSYKNKKLLEKARIDFKFDSGSEPLISVIIPTYNRSKLLIEQAIPSVLAQNYKNFELIVVGDHCTDDTERLVKKIDDSRLKFVNLSERGKYPSGGFNRWMVAGSVPRNKGVELASGEWIAPLDDDDEFTIDHLAKLYSFAVQNRFEMVYGKIRMEKVNGEWVNCGSWPLAFKKICHQGVMYHSMLKFLKYDVNAWKYCEPDDWNLWRRMEEAGVKMGFLDEVVGIHHTEFSQFNM